jgi:hypothetical protein
MKTRPMLAELIFLDGLKNGNTRLFCTVQWRTQEFYSGGGSTNSVEDRENGDLGAVAP